MFKKAKDIQPLPAGMADAMGAQLARQGFKEPEAVAEAPAVEVEAQPEEVSEAVASRGADKTKPGDGDTKMPKVADVTPEIGVISTKDKAAKSVETAVKAASKSQHEETEGFEIIQDGGKVEVVEAYESKKTEACPECGEQRQMLKACTGCGCSEAVEEAVDAVDPKAVKKKFDDRKDKDIDNDGDEDSSDEYLHKRRKAISKALED
jgi:hypothetical protein